LSEQKYYLAWSSIDGAGSEEIVGATDEQTAIDHANAQQAAAEANDNPWHYTYRVRDSSFDTIYNARTHK